MSMTAAIPVVASKGIDTNNSSNPLPPDLQRIADSPAFKTLQRRRNALALRLSLAMCAIYYGFVLMIAFGKETLATPLGGVITLGLPLGLGVILSAIVLTGIYTSRANREFDRLTADSIRAAQSKTA
ncbi:MAG: DUF485 domain-containing protein [Stagnimonas sp.]|nr:DUF485 domain-containing protein [Stagnimonas sp.]